MYIIICSLTLPVVSYIVLIPVVKRLIGETPVRRGSYLGSRHFNCSGKCGVYTTLVLHMSYVHSRVDVDVTLAGLVPKASVGDANLVAHITSELKFVLVYEHPVTGTILKMKQI